MMERSAIHAEAQECYGRRVIIRRTCRHRLPCPEAGWHNGATAHIDALTFRTEHAAQQFDLTQLAVPVRDAWSTPRSWDEAQAWLRTNDGP